MQKLSSNTKKLIDTILARPTQTSYLEILQAVFRCKRCGSCCTEMQGISMIDSDVKRLARHLKIGPKGFIEKYASKDIDTGLLVLRGRCPFYRNESSGCGSYSYRPTVCRLFPLINPVNGKLKPHLYEDCPGTVDLIKEIRDYKESHPVIELNDQQVRLFQLMAHVKILKDIGEGYNKALYKDLIRKLPPWESINREFGISLLAKVVSDKDLEAFLGLVPKTEVAIATETVSGVAMSKPFGW